MPRGIKSTKDSPLGEHISEHYYTAQEAQRALGINRNQYHYYIRIGALHPEAVIGKHRLIRKTEVQAIQQRIEAAILAADRLELEYRTATLEDMEQENRLAVLNFGPRANAPETRAARRRFLEICPEMTHYLFSYHTLVASMNLLPLRHSAILEFREGKRGWLFHESMIEQFEPGHPLECIIIDMMTTTNVSPDKRERYASYLLRGLAGTLKEWGSRGVDIKSISACAGTESGKRILESAGFQFLGERNGRLIYELEVSSSDLRLLVPYKLALASWKREHQQES